MTDGDSHAWSEEDKEEECIFLPHSKKRKRANKHISQMSNYFFNEGILNLRPS